jgi:predicted PhzF superfamily epimerase YddE/YHI9
MEALGTNALHVAKSKFDYLVEVASEDIVRALNPDHARLRTMPVRGVIVTSRATTKEWDFVSRFFAPGSGIDEDPVTGSAHCALTPYWSKKLGRTSFTARQMSPRGGTLQVELKGDRVLLRGQAVTVFRGEIA